MFREGSAQNEEAKQQRLEAAGWRVGSSADFLEPDDIEAQVAEMKVSLASPRWTASLMPPTLRFPE